MTARVYCMGYALEKSCWGIFIGLYMGKNLHRRSDLSYPLFDARRADE